jgi:hypothetical protein
MAGYYDYATSQYKLADGTVSNQATVFGTTAGGTSYIIDNHTGIGAKWNGQGRSNIFKFGHNNIRIVTCWIF